MINRRILIFGLIGLMVLTLFAVGKNLFSKEEITELPIEMEIVSSDDKSIPDIVEEEGLRKTTMYFQDSNGYLVPVMRRIPWEEGIAKSTLYNMVDSPELREVLSSSGLTPIIPAGTKINGMTIDPDTGLCKVDFTAEFTNKDNKEDEENLIKGVVYTLTEFPAVKSVKILIDGTEVNTMENGTSIAGILNRENINLLGKSEDGKSKVLVYYKGSSDTDFEYFVPVTIPTLAPMANVYTALDLLFEGPPADSDLRSDIPMDVNFQGVEIKDGTAYVDINLGAQSILTRDATIDDVIKNIGLTLSQFDEINAVEVLVDGEIINSAIPVFANEY